MYALCCFVAFFAGIGIAEAQRIFTVAGGGVGDGGPATGAGLFSSPGLCVDREGNLYIADETHNRIRKVDATTGIISTVAGKGTEGFSGDKGPATEAQLAGPTGISIDGTGNLYIADNRNFRIRKVDATTGMISTVAGTGPAGSFTENGRINNYGGSAGDGGLAIKAQMNLPYGVCVDRGGTLYIADMYNHRICKVDAVTGITSTVAGTGEGGFSGDQGPATEAQLAFPAGVCVDREGNLYIADMRNYRIRKVEVVTGTISTVAGSGSSFIYSGPLPSSASGDGGSAIEAQLGWPYGVSVDGSGNLYIADRSSRIRRVDATTRIISTVAGTETYGFSGDGSPATQAQLNGPTGVCLDSYGNLYIADSSNHRIRKVDAATGIIATIAGTGSGEFSGDGIPATQAQLSATYGIFVDTVGEIFFADSYNNRIRKVDGTGIISTIAGAGLVGTGYPDGGGFSGDTGLATRAQLNLPQGIFIDRRGNLYLADGFNERVRKVDASTGTISTIAGMGETGFSGDGGPAKEALLYRPGGLFVDGAGTLYIADSGNSCIRKVDASTGIISTVAGKGGEVGFSGDAGPATKAQLAGPQGIAVDRFGNLYIADTLNHRICKVDAATGIITTVAGGSRGFSGDGGLAIDAQVNRPYGVCIDGTGNLFIADTENYRIRKVDAATGAISTVVGTGGRGFSGDGEPATQAQLAYPRAIFVDAVGDLYIADGSRIRKVEGIATPSVPTAVLEEGQVVVLPVAVSLNQNYPNPFNATTTIHFSGPAENADSLVRLVIYNLAGHVARMLIPEVLPVGDQVVVWDGLDERGEAVGSGVYIYRLEGERFSLSRRMVLLK